MFPIEIPPLRERREDIVPLAEHFLRIAAQKLMIKVPLLAKAQRKELEAYPWPGNVRELQNVIERAAILAAHGAFALHLDQRPRPAPALRPSPELASPRSPGGLAATEEPGVGDGDGSAQGGEGKDLRRQRRGGAAGAKTNDARIEAGAARIETRRVHARLTIWSSERKGVVAAASRLPKPLQLSKARLDGLIDHALTDAYGESEQLTGFYTMPENDLHLPFETQILGVTDSKQFRAVCRNSESLPTVWDAENVRHPAVRRTKARRQRANAGVCSAGTVCQLLCVAP